MNTKEMILTILRKHIEEEVGLIKGKKEREVWKGRDFIQVGSPGTHLTISISLLHQALQTTSTRDLNYISTRLQQIMLDAIHIIKRAYSFDRFVTLSELEHCFGYSSSKGRISRLITRVCNGDVHLLERLCAYLEDFPFYWDDIIDTDETMRMIDEQIKQTSSPAIYELKQLRVA